MSFRLFSVFVFVATAVMAASAPAAGRSEMSLDADWRFLQQDHAGFQAAAFDDSSWRKLDVPHDWSIESPPDRENPSGPAGGFFVDGVGCYRKVFSVPQGDTQNRFFIHFDSVMANSDVWINGHLLGHRPSGYMPLHYDMTGYLNLGQGKSNTLAVRVDESSEPASRYYCGAGIIGHVKLLSVNPLHIEHDSLFVTTSDVTAHQATVNIQVTIINQSANAPMRRLNVNCSIQMESLWQPTRCHQISLSPLGSRLR